MAEKIGKEFENWFTDVKKAFIAGIGNPIGSDDYVGLKFVRLTGQGSRKHLSAGM